MYHILYVDDERDLLVITKTFLEKIGNIQVDTSFSATDSLNSGTLSTYDAIISDFQMPGMSGLEFLKTVRKNLPDMPFILFTGRGREEVVIEAINNGVDFYIQKGGDPSSQFAELTHKVKQAIERRRAEKNRIESEEKFSTVFRVNPSMEAITDLESGVLVDVNEAFLKGTGFSREEVVGKTSWEARIIAEDRESLLDRIKDLKPGGSIRNIELPILTKSGEILITRVNFEYLIISGRHLLFAQGIDITEWRRSEASKERFRFMVEKSGDEVYLVKPDGFLEYVNLAAARSLGYTVEEMLHLHISKFDPEYGPHFREYFEENKSHDMSPIETVHVGKDGKKIIKEIRTIFLRIEGEEYICGFARDITDQKKAVEALYESEEKYRILVENMQDGVFIAQDMIIKFVNEPYARLLGYTREEIIGQHICQFIDEQDLTLVMERHKRRMSGELLPDKYDFHLLHHDKKTKILVSMNVSTITYQGGFAAIGTIRDVSEQRRAEAVLRESEERYRTIFENTGTAMVIIEKDTTIILANSQFERLSGYPSDEIEGKKSWTDFVAADDLQRMSDQHRLRRENHEAALTTYEFRFISRYGEMHHIMLTIDVIPGTSRSVASLLDITDRKQMEDSLHQVNARLNLMNSITRHDIRNKVTALNGYLALAEDMEMNEEMAALINPMKGAISAITNQIEFSKLYQNLGVRKPEWIRVRGILPIAQVPPLIQFIADIPDLYLYTDPMLEKVFENLLDNSIRHGGGIHTIRLSVENGIDGLLLIWEDDGVGISDDEKPLIFERGYGKNTGLGLYLISNILAITGLTITETGVPGKGARFEIHCYLGSFQIRQND